MKPYQRRAEASFPYYKLATWDARSMTFRDGKVAFATENDAIKSAKKAGKYRVSVVTETGRRDMDQFAI